MVSGEVQKQGPTATKVAGWLAALLVGFVVVYTLRGGSLQLAGLRLLSESEYQKLVKTARELQPVRQASPIGQTINGFVTDSATELMWSKDLSPKSMAWNDAMLFCQQLVLGGFNDWRLPNKVELETLVFPHIDEGKVVQIDNSDPLGIIVPGHPKFPGLSGYIFSSSLVDGAIDQPWVMNLRNGHVFNGAGYNGYARCVRDRSRPSGAA